MAVPNTFAGATAAIPLSQLDQNFATTITLGNTAIQLGNTVTTLNNMTFANVTISSVASTFPNNYLANSSVTIGNTTVSLGGTTSSLGNVTLNNCTTGNATSDSANVAGFIGLPQNSQNGAYNVVIGDAGKHIFHPVGQAAATYTIPANSNVAFTVGTAITFINMSANAVTIAVTSDVMYLGSSGTTGNRTLAQYGVATAVKITSTNWIISGTALT
jgi:hypothetical protein